MRRLPHFPKKTKKKNSVSSWKITYSWFKPAQENLREALCTLGNGYFGTRGAVTESAASRIHYPGTYIAGVYNKLATHIAGRTILNEDFVNCPNWLPLTFRIGKGEWVVPTANKILFYHQELDLRRGVLLRKIRFQNRSGQRTTIETQRIVHMENPHCTAIRYMITPENYEGEIVVRSALDGAVQNTGVARYRQLNSKHLKPGCLGTFNKNGIYLSMKTSQTNIEISEAAKVYIFTPSLRRGAGLTDSKEIRAASKILTKDKREISQEFTMFVRKKERCVIEKIVSIYTSKDRDIRSPLTTAIKSVKNSRGFNVLLKTHRRAWMSLWKQIDIQVEGNAFSQKVLRFHAFHLLQTASIHNTMIDAGLPARGLHGEAYRGHIFWDEVFAMSFFDLHTPEISKALFLYRYGRLPEARKYAEKNGYKGAMFPWQSGSTGIEETQTIHLNPMSGKWGPDHSRIQRHISFAIAYNVWQYWKRTGDLDFLTRYGAELLLSIAQFGASLSIYNPKDRKYHTQGLMGPDEFHEKYPGVAKPGLKDNAYTNLLIVWTLFKAQQILSFLPKYRRIQLVNKLGLGQKEMNRWKDITRKMKIVINDHGIISQFDGYFKLKELNWEAYKAKYGNIQRMDRILKAEGKSPNEYKIAKQADVLMIFYLLPLSEIKHLLHRLGYRFNKSMLKKNYNYYVERTSHGSTLSKIVHCYVANLLGKSKESWQWFSEVLESDIYDTQGGTTFEGIHVGVMGGSIDIAIRGFAGIMILEDRVRINPSLPKSWHNIKLRFCYKESWVFLFITKDLVTIFIRGPKSKQSVPIEIFGKLHHLSFGKAYKIRYNP